MTRIIITSFHKEDGWRGAQRELILFSSHYRAPANTRSSTRAEIVFQRYLADYLGPRRLHCRA